MGEIKLDPKNYRIHTDKNKEVIRKSLTNYGTGRSVLMDKDNVLIAGSGVYEQAEELGLKVRIVESDGTELVVVKRTDLATDDKKKKLLALADNQASDTSIFDMSLVLEDFSDVTLTELHFELDTPSDFSIIDDLENNAFVGGINKDADTFGFTLQIPKEYQDEVNEYVRANTKAPLVEYLLKKIQNA